MEPDTYNHLALFTNAPLFAAVKQQMLTAESAAKTPYEMVKATIPAEYLPFNSSKKKKEMTKTL